MLCTSVNCFLKNTEFVRLSLNSGENIVWEFKSLKDIANNKRPDTPMAGPLENCNEKTLIFKL